MDNTLLTKKAWYGHFFIALGLFVLICALQTWTRLDFAFQNLWFNTELQQWWLTAEEFQATRWLWYGGAKKAISILAGICVFVFIWSFFNKKAKIWRKCCVLIALSLLFVPLVVGAMKKATNIYCPNQLVEYQGSYEQHVIFELLHGERADEQRGLCFPAGHCSGGYALLMLFFALPYPYNSKKFRWLGLLFGLAFGSLMGGYQIVRGEHFLSDTLATICVAWMINLLVIYGVELFNRKHEIAESPKLLSL